MSSDVIKTCLTCIHIGKNYDCLKCANGSLYEYNKELLKESEIEKECAICANRQSVNICNKCNNGNHFKNESIKDIEMVNSPKHYNQYPVEVIDMMQLTFGIKETANFCLLNSFKYRMRVGLKSENTIEQDLKKEQWYLNKYNELTKRIKESE